MRRAPTILFLLFFPALVAGVVTGSDTETAFAEANARFEAGDHAGASGAYEDLATAGHLSPELFFNLGTSKYREGKAGEAVLWMRRALHLDPGMAEARQSLHFLRTQLAFLEFAGGGIDRFLSATPPGAFRWTVSILLWSALIGLVAAFSFPALRGRRSTFVTLSLVATMAAVVAWRAGIYREKRVAPERFATVTEKGSSAFTSPTPGAAAVIDLPPGSELRLVRQSGSWFYAEIPGELRGWVRQEAAEPLWPVPVPSPESNEESPPPKLEIPRSSDPPLLAPGGGAI